MELEEIFLSEVTQSQKTNMEYTHSYMYFWQRANDSQPIIHTARGARKEGGPQEKNTWSPKEGEGTRTPEPVGSMGRGREKKEVGMGEWEKEKGGGEQYYWDRGGIEEVKKGDALREGDSTGLQRGLTQGKC